MARETAQQRNERYAREQLEAEAKSQAEWYPRLVKAMAKAHKLGFELRVFDDGNMTYRNPHNRDVYCIGVKTEWSYAAECLLAELESEMADHEARFAELERQAQVRREALAKLTKEEREALNLC